VLVEDTDGNYVLMNSGGFPLSSVVDTLGRQVTFSNAGGNGWTHVTSISYKDSNGVQQSVTFNYTLLTLMSTTPGQYYTGTTPFALPAQNNCGSCQRHVWVHQPSPNSGHWMLTSIVLPNQKSYTFSYNGYGEITKIQFPTGGYVAYDYAAYRHQETYWADQAWNVVGDFREVLKRHVCRDPSGVCGGSGTPEDITTFTPTNADASPANTKMDVVDPLGYKNHYEFSPVEAGDAYVPYSSSRETLHQVYSPSGALLRTTQTSYINIPSQCSCPAYPQTLTTTLNDTIGTALTSTVSYVYDTYSATVMRPPYDPLNGIAYTSQSATAVSYPIDNPTQIVEYDYGAGVLGPKLRQRNATWLHVLNGVDYNNTLHIMNRKTDDQVLDPSNNKLAETQYEYDSFTEGLTASGAVQHDSTFNTSYTRRGKLTAIKRWRNTDNTYLTTRFQYDDAGNGRKVTDPLNHFTTMSHADSWGNTSCLPSGGNAASNLTSVTDALGHVTSAKYNSCSSTLASVTDPNSQVTSYNYDLLNRRTQTTFPDTGQTSICYSDVSGATCQTASGSPLKAVTTSKITSSLNLVSTAVVDGLGRITQTQINSDPEGPVYTDTTYDGKGRKSTVSNPYRSTSDSTYGTTTYVYDALDRNCVVVPPDGTAVSPSACPTTPPARDVFTSYAGNCSTVTDQAGKTRKSCTDAIGRLTGIWEDPSGLHYETDYQYTVLNDLSCVAQKATDTTPLTTCAAAPATWRPRSFTYNSLSQLVTAANPESGTLSYSYDANGNLQAKTTPLPNQSSGTVTTNYSYDSLNRLTGKSYVGLTTPAASYFYDQTSYNGLTISNGIGRRSGMSDGSGATAWNYDSMGRVASLRRKINGLANTATYTYPPYLNGEVANLTYFSGSQVAYTWSGADRPLTAIDPYPINFVKNATYAPAGALAGAAFGAYNTGFPGTIVSNSYNNRLQPAVLSAASSDHDGVQPEL
jgi:YD repeat-containing protein